MADYENQTFGAVELQIAGHRFINCTFRGTKLVYSGGPTPIFAGEKSEFIGAEFEFAGEGREALNYIRLLHFILGKEGLDALLAVERPKRDGPSH